MSKTPILQIPSIETPTTDPRSLQNTLLQVKEAIELIAGVRGNRPFAFASDMDATLNRLKKLESNAGWDILYAQEFNTNGFNVFNLGAYRLLRFSLHVIPAAAIPIYMRVGNGSTFIGATNSYLGTGIYNIESNVAPTGYIISNTTIVPLSWDNNIASGNPFGLTVNGIISNFNIGRQTKIAMHTSLYNGTLVLQGNLHIREAATAARDSIHISSIGDATNLTGNLILEGFKL